MAIRPRYNVRQSIVNMLARFFPVSKAVDIAAEVDEMPWVPLAQRRGYFVWAQPRTIGKYVRWLGIRVGVRRARLDAMLRRRRAEGLLAGGRLIRDYRSAKISAFVAVR